MANEEKPLLMSESIHLSSFTGSETSVRRLRNARSKTLAITIPEIDHLQPATLVTSNYGNSDENRLVL